MSISENIKKLLVAGAAVIMAASAGANLNNVNAKRRSRYHYRTHRVYRKHAKRSYHRRARNHTYRHKRAHRHIYRRRGRATGKRNMFSYFTPAELAHYAKIDGYSSANEFKQDSIVDNNHHIYGPAKMYNIDGNYSLLTPYGVRYTAKINHIPVSRLIKDDVKHATKWWTWDGSPTKLADKVAEQDAFKLLNKTRASKGIGPVTMDPDLQALAEERAKRVYEGKDPYNEQGGYHMNQNGIPYTIIDAQKAHIPYSGSDENVSTGIYGDNGSGSYLTPKQIAKSESDWGGPDDGHVQTRELPDNKYGGIGINNGACVEEFSDGPTPANASVPNPSSF